MSELRVQIEKTPNPATLKFSLNQSLTQTPQEFLNPEDSAASPLARKLFGFPWCQSVFIGTQFVTVTKQDWVDWDILAEPLAGLIKEHVERGEPIILEVNSQEEAADDSAVVKEIKRIINYEIRPAVAMDGGDVVFHSYKNNTVYLHMRGACAGCPGSQMTLKVGIEGRLRESIPEINEVVAI